MALYPCHFLDTQDRIEAHEEIDATSLADAIDRANAMLARKTAPQRRRGLGWQQMALPRRTRPALGTEITALVQSRRVSG